MKRSPNEAFYLVIRMNLQSAFKGAYIEDPRFLVHKVDQLYSRHHSLEHEDFVKEMNEVLISLKEDFSAAIFEYQNLCITIDNLLKFIEHKVREELVE